MRLWVYWLSRKLAGILLSVSVYFSIIWEVLTRMEELGQDKTRQKADWRVDLAVSHPLIPENYFLGLLIVTSWDRERWTLPINF